MINVKEALSYLGLKVEDRITGFEGIVTTIGFDLYGCVQAIVNPGLDKDKQMADSKWFDITRLKIKSFVPVMGRPDFDIGVKLLKKIDGTKKKSSASKGSGFKPKKTFNPMM